MNPPTVRSPGAALCPRSCRGFTLVELLVVIAIVGILSSLLVPAVRGLVGVGGRRGGMNALTSTIEKARLAAIESGSKTYVGFLSGSDAGSSSVIVFRDPRDGETNTFVPLSRWVRMPNGIFIDTAAGQDLEEIEIDEDVLPVAPGSATNQLPVLAFDRFGKLEPDDRRVAVRVGEKPSQEEDFVGSPNNYFLITVHPLTGRVFVQDMMTAASSNP